MTTRTTGDTEKWRQQRKGDKTKQVTTQQSIYNSEQLVTENKGKQRKDDSKVKRQKRKDDNTRKDDDTHSRRQKGTGDNIQNG